MEHLNLEDIALSSFFNPQPFLYIIKEPLLFSKFLPKSQSDLRTTLTSEVLLNSAPQQSVYIVSELYSQIGPPLLSPHILVSKGFGNNIKPFPVEEMERGSNGDLIGSYTLRDKHIFRRTERNKVSSLHSKLTQMELWKSGNSVLTDDVARRIEATVEYNYADVNCDGKVYLGFTAYIKDPIRNTMIIYAETVFSGPIYDCNNSVVLQPFSGNKSGGSLHRLNLGVSEANGIQIKLYDSSWFAFATNVQIDDNGIQFQVPSYTGLWCEDEANHLVQIEVIGCDVIAKRPIKFLYTNDF